MVQSGSPGDNAISVTRVVIFPFTTSPVASQVKFCSDFSFETTLADRVLSHVPSGRLVSDPVVEVSSFPEEPSFQDSDRPVSGLKPVTVQSRLVLGWWRVPFR